MVEFQSLEEIRRNYPDGVRELADGGTRSTIAGQPTDDSEMALLLARILTERGVYDPDAALRAYQFWLDSDPFDCGMTIATGLRGCPNLYRQANGAMMRINPLGIFGVNHPSEIVGDWAKQYAALTHPNPVCLQANTELNQDLDHIEVLLTAMEKITPEHDAKLQHLKTHIVDKISNSINAANKKILLFTAFSDTANYLYDNLAPELLTKLSIHSAKVTGKGAPQSTIKSKMHKRSYDFQELLTLFSPRSKEKAVVLPDEPNEVDLLIGTDCISEGQNLQDCDYLINYDIHWNPVRIIQRFGRVDRIGSPNVSIQLVNYWPDISLDEYINLKERVESRMMIADVTATGDDNVLSAQANDVSYRSVK